MFARSLFRRSAYSELQLVGSRWTRILAKSTMQDVGPPHVRAHLATPCITIIPTLHVASIKFYDRVLEYMQQAVRRNPATVVLLEGICDSDEAEKQQLSEYLQIAQSSELRDMMLEKADGNNLYPAAVVREICAELALDYATLQKYESTVRLQECYLKPKVAALCGTHLRNSADLNMHEVQQLLAGEAARLAALGESLPSSVSVSEIGKFPIVRKNRERKVAAVARLQCEKWLEEEVEGEVIVPWGFYHTEAIMHYIFEANATQGSSGSSIDGAGQAEKLKPGSEQVSAEAGGGPKEVPAAAKARPSAVFVEADELVAKVPFDLPKEILEPSVGPPPGQPQEAGAAAGKSKG